MRRLLTSTLLATAAASAAVVLAASSASAATFSVSGANPDGSASGDAATTTLKTPSATLTCTASHTDASGLIDGTSSGSPVASIDSLSFSGCTLSFISFTVTTDGFPWSLNALSESGGVVQGQIAGSVHAHIHGVNAPCEADITGTTVPGTYTNDSSTLSIPGTGQDLTVTTVDPNNNCAGLIHTGDAASFSGDYAVDPPVVITQTG
jgi:uncharacterized metal-binding protein